MDTSRRAVGAGQVALENLHVERQFVAVHHWPWLGAGMVRRGKSCMAAGNPT